MTQRLLTLPVRIGFGAARTAFDLSTRIAGTALDILPLDILRPSSPETDTSEKREAPETSERSSTSRPRRQRTGESRTNGQPSAPPDERRQERAEAPPKPKPEPESEPKSEPKAGPKSEREPEPEPHGEPQPEASTTSEPSTQQRLAPPIPPVTPPEAQPDTPLTHQQADLKTIDDEDELVAEFAEPGAEDGAGAQLDIDAPWEGYADMKANAVIARINQATPEELALVELYERTHRKRQSVLSAAEKRLTALSPPETS